MHKETLIKPLLLLNLVKTPEITIAELVDDFYFLQKSSATSFLFRFESLRGRSSSFPQGCEEIKQKCILPEPGDKAYISFLFILKRGFLQMMLFSSGAVKIILTIFLGRIQSGKINGNDFLCRLCKLSVSL